MPRGRKRRHDPDEAPIDGDYAMDQVLERDPAFVYKWLHDEDVPKWKARGAVKVLRESDAAKAAYDMGGGDGYQNMQLTLYKVPRERQDRITRTEQQLQDNVMSGVESEANSQESRIAGGNFSRRVAA